MALYDSSNSFNFKCSLFESYENPVTHFVLYATFKLKLFLYYKKKSNIWYFTRIVKNTLFLSYGQELILDEQILPPVPMFI